MNKEGSAEWRLKHTERMALGEREMCMIARHELSGFLDRWPWQWWLTFTFRDDVSLGQAYAAWRGFARWLRDHGAVPSWFRCVEWQRDRHVPHFHALVFGVDHAVRRMTAVDWWWDRYGIGRVHAYDSTRGAVCYVGKYLLKDDARCGDWDLHVDGQGLLWGGIDTRPGKV